MNFNKSYILSGLVVILVASGFFYYQKNKSEEFRLITDETEMTKFVMTHTQEELDEYRRKVDEIKAEDTFGGKTPEETLRMYIDALKVGDVESASRYFRVEKQNEMFEKLSLAKENNVLGVLISDLEKNKEGLFLSDSEYRFRTFDSEGVAEFSFDLVLDNQSGLWKLESL